MQHTHTHTVCLCDRLTIILAPTYFFLVTQIYALMESPLHNLVYGNIEYIFAKKQKKKQQHTQTYTHIHRHI
jgi:hypothetical protein